MLKCIEFMPRNNPKNNQLHLDRQKKNSPDVSLKMKEFQSEIEAIEPSLLHSLFNPSSHLPLLFDKVDGEMNHSRGRERLPTTSAFNAAELNFRKAHWDQQHFLKIIANRSIHYQILLQKIRPGFVKF